ncbi:MAG: hypothetical protein UX09_C0038G0003 [Candidatus Uhrbacteria bacterium GW2011_GWE2_45_35]|uniref:Protease PrsW n=2 Tax=Candidatus Uhriibacteriota TaxID=1752732 RepID=A0A0G1M9Z9_9BACT|nr:MAG: hypothetical protein UW63_C0069G0005 [Candidatus Uhrbacteria bacterium GW2011_GWF2_44_350]KKU06911.1 MAG: hypothetical protein UX09_C0038G0003 [Candidatus Uhrbacteria bacterium GW2011_GWE2_45_35]HBR80887.1 hypothetical protein [Candidatus Uhrbacteria bacterium]HCU31417.1 hypothetical protein [Candidatus Uhrbacteria bacterium]
MQITINKITILKFLPAIGLAILFLIFWINNPHWFWVELWFLLEIVVLTSFTRTLSLKTGIGTFLMGITVGFGVIYLIGSGFEAINMTKTARAFIMPLLEEAAKILPILITIRLFGGLKKPRLNLSDFIFLGACAGAGFSMLEKYFWDSVYFPFTYGPHFGSTYLFSDALGVYASGEPFGYVGHAAATVFVALGLGLTYKFLRSKKPFWLVPVLVAFAWVGIEHIILNYYYTPRGEAFMIFGGGQMTPWIILIALIATIVFEAVKTNELLKQNTKVSKKLRSAFKQIKDFPSFVGSWSTLRAVNYLAWLKTK